MDNDSKDIILTIVSVIIGGAIIIGMIIGMIFGFMALYAKYNVWSSSLSGQAILAQAEYSRQVTVREAQAKMDSAKLLAQAEIERAKGVAEANLIIGESLKGNESYLRYLWIDSIQQTSNQIIYVPTEAGLPVLEAGRLK